MDSFLHKLVGLYELLNKRVSIEDTMEEINKTFKDFIPFDKISIVLIENTGSIYVQAVHSNYALVLKKGFSTSIHGTSLQNVISSKQHRVIHDYRKYLDENPNSQLTKLIMQEGILSSITCPLIANELCFGVIIFSSKNPNVYNDTCMRYANMISNNMAIVIEKSLLVDDLLIASITGFARLVEAKDSDTGLHIERMQNYSKLIALELQKNEKFSTIIDELFIENIFRFSPLHDIGKVGIADGILLKPAKLTPEEFEVMKKHTIIGGEVLKNASNNFIRNGRNFFDVGIDITLGHHEKYNGKGYPFGLSGDQIPLSARIVAVADVFDALTSRRVYKNAIAIDDATKIIVDEKGKSFDPDVVQAFCNTLDNVLDIFNKYQENIDFDRR